MCLKRTIILTAAGVLAVAALTVGLMAGEYWLTVAIVGPPIWLFVSPLVFITLIAALVLNRRRKRTIVVLGGCCVLAIVAPLGAMLGDWLGNLPFERAQRVVERIAAALDEYHTKFGLYPPTPDDARGAGIEVPMPGFQSHMGFYHVADEGESFALWLDDPRAFLFQEAVYDSETRKWGRLD